MPAPTQLLARSLSDFGLAVQSRTPRRATVILEFDDGETFDVKFAERQMTAAAAADTPAMPGVEQGILIALDRLPAGHTMSGEDLASETGYTHGGWFRRKLADMAREGKIVSNGRRGYSAASAAPAGIVADSPTSIDAKILRVVDSMAPGELMSGAEIADRAGHSLSGTFQARLAALARDGEIRVEGKRGYGPIVEEPDEPEAPPANAGRWLSPAETLIVERITAAKATTPARKLTGAIIAGMTGHPHDAHFKAVVRNLVDRGILTHDDAAGYELAPKH